MQMLRAYAQADLTSDQLANPPVRTVPERLSVRGCCATWAELDGVWATGAGYHTKILRIYDLMLRTSLVARGGS